MTVDVLIYVRGMVVPIRRRAGIRRLGAMILASVLAGCDGPGPSAFVTVGPDGFTLAGRPYFPLTVNYGLSIRMMGEDLWPCPSPAYREHEVHPPTREGDLRDLRADMALIKEMGFNSVRLGFGAHRDPEGCILAVSDWSFDTITCLSDGGRYERYLQALDTAMDAVADAGLKAVVLLEIDPDEKHTEEHFIRIAEHFKQDPTILAYDLFNEPLYFDEAHRPKSEVRRITRHWRAIMSEHAPDQLYTIGLVGLREVFSWDPAVIDADFLSFHPYEHEPGQVLSEMHWYREHVKLPWIIGETGVPADNDSVPYEEQSTFARSTMQQALACGAAGYSWWQYKDVSWAKFHSNFMGVLARGGTTRTATGDHQVEGIRKPVWEVFRSFDANRTAGDCERPDNYFNYSQHSTARITGRVVDEERRPVEGGVVLGWNNDWTRSYVTVSKPDGSFDLRGDFHFHHWMASAPEWSMVRGDLFPTEYRTDRSGIPTFFLGELMLEREDPAAP